MPNKVEKINKASYSLNLPDEQAWGQFSMQSARPDGAPFDWARYVSFGAFQIAYNQEHFAVRGKNTEDAWDNWFIIK